MGRQNKVGLDYFELDCHMDEKIDLIEAEYGLKGFAIVVKLYQSIYSGFGYYCEWTPDISVLWARRLGLSHGGDFGKVGIASEEGSLPGFPKNLINDVVAASIRRDIFSKDIFNRYGILTSMGVQKRYLNATSKREKIELKKEYLLISIPQNRENVVINSISSVGNAISSDGNTQSKEEKSREENIIARDTVFQDFISVYPKKGNEFLAETQFCRLLVNDCHLTAEELIEAAKNYADACKVLGTAERFIKAPQNFLNDNYFVNYLPGNYKPPKKPTKKNTGWEVEKREYDFAALEAELMRN